MKFRVTYSNNWAEFGINLKNKELSIPGINDIDFSAEIISRILKNTKEGSTLWYLKKDLEKDFSKHREWAKLNEVFHDELGVYTEIQPLIERVYGIIALLFYSSKRYANQIQSQRRPYWMFASAMHASSTKLEKALNDKCYNNHSKIWEYFYPPNSPFESLRVRSLSDFAKEKRSIIVESDPDITIKNINFNNSIFKIVSVKIEGEYYSCYPGWGYNYFELW